MGEKPKVKTIEVGGQRWKELEKKLAKDGCLNDDEMVRFLLYIMIHFCLGFAWFR